jgi:hypothetical protein
MSLDLATTTTGFYDYFFKYTPHSKTIECSNGKFYVRVAVQMFCFHSSRAPDIS